MKIVPTGLALSLFLAITFALVALAFYVAHSGMAMSPALTDGETMMGRGMAGGHLGAGGFLIGLGVSYALGWYAAFVFVPLYNFFNRKSPQ